MTVLTHLDDSGKAAMVDVSSKALSRREACAAGSIHMSAEAFNALVEDSVPKGNVLATARLAAIMATKRTSAIIPLCHNITLSCVRVDFNEQPCCINCEVTTIATGQTGVEMEAIIGVQAALATIYDMLKAIDRAMVIDNVRLLHKSGGQRGNFSRS